MSFVSSNNSLSVSVNSSLPFITNITKSASSILDKDFSTPIFSTLSSVFLIPAVSIILSKIPSNSISPSTVSLVVPSISVTIAFSSFNSLFKIDDFPTLGLPTITVFMPFLIVIPFSESFTKSINFSFNFFIIFLIFSSVITSIS